MKTYSVIGLALLCIRKSIFRSIRIRISTFFLRAVAEVQIVATFSQIKLFTNCLKTRIGRQSNINDLHRARHRRISVFEFASYNLVVVALP